MKTQNCVLLLILAICAGNITAKAQSSANGNWLDVKPKTVTLYSRIAHRFEGYGKSAFSFNHGLRSDSKNNKTRNNYELEYGGISINGDTDWFNVKMVGDDLSRIKDLGELNWSEIFDVPYLPASIQPQQGIRFPSKTETYEDSSNGQVTKVIAGHMYILHSKDSGSDFYTLFRVDKIVPSDQVTISWKLVPSPEQ